MENILVNAIQNLVSIPPEEEQKLINISREITIAKGDYFLKEGQSANYFGFVKRGLFRYYYLNQKGNEFTKGFFPEYSFLSAYDAMIENRVSYFSIEALEESEVVLIDYFKWKEHLFQKNECWKDFLILLLQKGYTKKVSREREFLLFDAEQRYSSFLSTYPGLDLRVKQHIIASYLGITSVALSRIRKKMGLVNIG